MGNPADLETARTPLEVILSKTEQDNHAAHTFVTVPRKHRMPFPESFQGFKVRFRVGELWGRGDLENSTRCELPC